MTEIIKDGKYHWNTELQEWQMFGKEQNYKGWRIVSVTVHGDWLCADRHREYLIIRPEDGEESWIRVNKRGGNIAEIKAYIDRVESKETGWMMI